MGFPNVKRCFVLEHLVKMNGWKHGAEIGVNRGGTFFHLLDTCPDLTMIAVDSWEADVPEYGDLRPVGEEVCRRAESYGDRAVVLHGDSLNMARVVVDESLDFCFIDARVA
jgi:predicted O-methyltransferase YrrM